MHRPTEKELSIDRLLTLAVEHNASDLHIRGDAPVTLRVDGELVKLEDFHLDSKTARSIVYSAMTETQRNRFERDLELDFAYQLGAKSRFRVNVFMTREMLGASFRHIRNEIPTIADLHLPAKCEKLSMLPRGLVLVCGPTGSGKSTTIASIIDHINETRAVRIITVEDPVEYVFRDKVSSIVQREVGRDTHSFPEALKHALRQDPDVLVIGEMRDLETIATVLTAAETGHLVFATLHTLNAQKNIDRIIDVFHPDQQEQVRYQMAETLQAVLSQLLLKGKGGRGRYPAVEILLATAAVRSLIRERKTHQIKSVIQTSTKLGMQTMEYALAKLVYEDRVNLKNALSVAESEEEVREALHMMKVSLDVRNNYSREHDVS